MTEKGSGRISFFAFLAFQGIAILMTWPLVVGMNRDVPGDLGDALLNMWIMGWGAEKVPALLTGQISLQDYWNANIFHPEPLALSYSEHLFGQVVQILPLYHLTGNIILCYNLLFLTSFSLSGLGMFLLTRDVLRDVVPGERGPQTGQLLVIAAFIAGLIYAFYPFRIAQVAHIQSLSSQWIPLALFGLRRFVRTRSTPALAGGAAALLMQNWSCGYYLVYFAPFVPLFLLHELWITGTLSDWRRWAGLAVAAVVVAGATYPLVALYVEAQRVYGFQRPLGEAIGFSADVYSYFASAGPVHLWGSITQSMRKPEGELFIGLIPMVLALASVLTSVRGFALPARWFTRSLAAIVLLQVTAFVMIVFTGGFITSVGSIPVRATNATRLLTNATIALVLLLAVSPNARRGLVRALRSPVAFLTVLTILAVWMSLGPTPHTRGQPLQIPGLYGVFYDHIPGFSGLRVPARYAMIASVFLSVAAGIGAARLLRRTQWPARAGSILAVVLLAEAAFAPMAVNVSWGGNFVQPPARVFPAADAPAVYHQLAAMPDAPVIAEFPFGDVAWELRYVYYSTVHWKRLVNGYSGGFPSGYKTRAALLQRVDQHPDEAWRALRDIGTTHVVVHESAFSADQASVVKTWLDDHFAVEIARFDDGDLLYDLSAAWQHQKHH